MKQARTADGSGGTGASGGTGGRVAVGHPVDVSSGEMFDLWTDLVVPGSVDLTWVRRYSTALLAKPPSILGRGWTANFLASLRKDGSTFVFTDAEGAEIRFPDPDGSVWSGTPVRNLGAFSELRREGGLLTVVKWIPAAHSSERYQFNPGDPGKIWPLMACEDAAGHAIDLSWDANGRLLFARQRRERRGIVFRYNDLGRISEVEAGGENFRAVRARYFYDRSGRLIKAEVAGATETYEYDDQDRIIREKTRTGGIFEFKYDDKGRCVRSAGTDRYFERSFRYMTHVGWTEVTDSLGNLWRYHYLPSGQVVQAISPMAAETATVYDAEGRIVEEKDASGGAVKYAYSDAGDYASITDPLGQVTAFAHNDRHQLVKFTDTAGSDWTLEYDPRGRLLASTDPLGAKWECRLDANGDAVLVRDALGNERKLQYDALGNLAQQADWQGGIFAYAYDPMGNMVSQTDPLGRTTRYAYNEKDLVTAILHPQGATRRLEYDASGQLTVLTDEEGKVTRYRWGTCGRLIKCTRPDGSKRKFFWSTEPDRVDKVIDELGRAYVFQYDADGRPIKEVGFEGETLERVFDAALNPVILRDAAGLETALEYDLLGRLLKKSLPDGTASEFTYHPLGALASAANPVQKVVFERDLAGRIVKEIQGSHAVESEYDLIGNRIGCKSDLSYAARFEWSPNQDLASLNLDGKWDFRFQYDPMGREILRELPGGGSIAQRFDTMDRMTEQGVEHSAAGRDLPLGRKRETGSLGAVQASMRILRSFAYDPAGVTQTVKDAYRGETVYSHDQVGNLTGVRRESGRSEHFAWDAAGNPTAYSRMPGPRDVPGPEHGEQSCEYGPGNRLVRKGKTRFEYDPVGRLIRKTQPGRDGKAGEERVWEYGWNGEGWLEWAKDPQGAVWKYAYDAFGRRVGKEGPAGATRYVWDCDTLLHEIDPQGKIRTWTFDDEFNPLGAVAGGEIHLYVNDQTGTPQETLRPDGTVSWAASYAGWGLVDELHVAEFDNPVRFRGQWHDPETGLHYNRFRHYDPDLGRFISPDPIGTAGDLNGYRYAPSPVQWSDPFGLETVTENVGGRTYTYERDSQGRTTRAEGPICNPDRIQNEDRNKYAQTKVSKGTGDHAGHLIGNQFGGPGGQVNLVRMCETLNLGKWKSMEYKLGQLAKKNRVEVVVNVHYDDNTKKPARFTVTAKITDRKGKVTTKRWTHQNC